MKFGVIGGNGVAATNLLCEMVERKITDSGAFRDAHHPEMIIWQATSVPSRSMFLEGRGPDWRPGYINIAKEFLRLGCDIGCMCCNTAHYAIDEISTVSGLKFINLLYEVAHCVEERNVKSVEVFCSDGARKFDIYKAAFSKVCPSVEVVYPDEDRQTKVTKVICDVKSRARFLNNEDVGSPARLLSELVGQSRCPVVLGCTDLRVAFRDNRTLPEGVLVDSLECLADCIVKRAANGN